MEYPVDFLEDQIFPGDKIAYPGRQGSSQWMNYAKVLKIEEYKPYWSHSEKTYFRLLCQRWDPVKGTFSGKKVTVFNIHNVVIVP